MKVGEEVWSNIHDSRRVVNGARSAGYPGTETPASIVDRIVVRGRWQMRVAAVTGQCAARRRNAGSVSDVVQVGIVGSDTLPDVATDKSSSHCPHSGKGEISSFIESNVDWKTITRIRYHGMIVDAGIG
jgi:hypothetical protein